ncbi:MAG: hypothetical protein ACRDP6_01225 [Actinoallomurus sp.]
MSSSRIAIAGGSKRVEAPVLAKAISRAVDSSPADRESRRENSTLRALKRRKQLRIVPVFFFYAASVEANPMSGLYPGAL